MIIHDDDIDVKKLIPSHKDDAAAAVDQLNVDEAPLVADFIDERPVEEVQLEEFRKSKKWKLMDVDKGTSAVNALVLQIIYFYAQSSIFCTQM